MLDLVTTKSMEGIQEEKENSAYVKQESKQVI